MQVAVVVVAAAPDHQELVDLVEVVLVDRS
jgi:hypothetical protein